MFPTPGTQGVVEGVGGVAYVFSPAGFPAIKVAPVGKGRERPTVGA